MWLRLACVIQSPAANDSFSAFKGVIMPRGREKDRKTRKKHRKNVTRVKALVKARQKRKRTGKKS